MQKPMIVTTEGAKLISKGLLVLAEQRRREAVALEEQGNPDAGKILREQAREISELNNRVVSELL